MDDNFLPAIVLWFQTFDNLSRSCQGIDDLFDGTILNEVLFEIDPQWFKRIRPVDKNANWILKFSNLKKIYKILLGYYEEILKQPTEYLEVPDLTRASRDGDEIELSKLMKLVIVCAVQCADNQKFISMIQGLDESKQHSIMVAIEEIIGRLSSGNSEPKPAPSVITDASEDVDFPEKRELEQVNRRMREQLEQLQIKYEEITTEKFELQSRLRDFELSGGVSEDVQIGLGVRAEIDNLRSDFEKSESRRIETEATLKKQNSVIADLTKKLDESNKKASEIPRLKDQLDEFKHMAEKLIKSETMIEKYKKKLEDVSDMRYQIKSLEEQNIQLAALGQQYEDEHRKNNSLRSLMDTYKEQISASESKISTLQVEHSKMEFELKESQNKILRLEGEKKQNMEWVYSLEEKLRDKEHGNGILEDATDHMIDPLQPNKVSLLDREMEKHRGTKSEDLDVLENQLDDAIRLKATFEQKYKEAYQKQLALQNELDQLKVMSSESQNLAESHILSKLKQENITLNQRVRVLEAEQAAASITRSPDPPTSINSQPAPVVDNSPEYEENRRLNAQLLQIRGEREQMQSKLVEARDQSLQFEKMNSELRAAMSALDQNANGGSLQVKHQEAIQKVVRLTEQNAELHKSMKSAKEHILWQDKFIKEQKDSSTKSDNFAEAIAMYTAQVKEKTVENERLKRELNDVRVAAKREQKLILSAWNNFGMKTQTTSPPKPRGNVGEKLVKRTNPNFNQESWLNFIRDNNK
ncbi:Protein Hook 1 [Nowakowskiella sp. JEL0078]|nr:Protein Hook 1 [Nowakowskiella sp. JEL0078]